MPKNPAKDAASTALRHDPASPLEEPDDCVEVCVAYGHSPGWHISVAPR